MGTEDRAFCYSRRAAARCGSPSADRAHKPLIDPRHPSERADVATSVTGLRVAHRIATAPVLAPWADAVIPPAAASDAELAGMSKHIGTVYQPVETLRMGAEDDPSAAEEQSRYRTLLRPCASRASFACRVL
ncbi:GMC oxidoreductase [Sphingopyxis sp. YR583]|uniref:GMC oxidoreductase n=1 Tax=Sphingopyxis sp. YR583 TaxID=1881047 RepID=UPI000B823E4A